jgi:hypothetical protein
MSTDKTTKIFRTYCLVRKSNHPFLVLKGVTEMSFFVLKRISGNSEENLYSMLQFGNIKF